MSRRCRHPIRVGIRTVLLAGAFALGGCGQTGPLYLPPPPPKPAPPASTAPAPATSTPAPNAVTQ